MKVQSLLCEWLKRTREYGGTSPTFVSFGRCLVASAWEGGWALTTGHRTVRDTGEVTAVVSTRRGGGGEGRVLGGTRRRGDLVLSSRDTARSSALKCARGD